SVTWSGGIASVPWRGGVASGTARSPASSHGAAPIKAFRRAQPFLRGYRHNGPMVGYQRINDDVTSPQLTFVTAPATTYHRRDAIRRATRFRHRPAPATLLQNLPRRPRPPPPARRERRLRTQPGRAVAIG